MIQDKPNYLPAYYVLAQFYEKAGDIGKATSTLEAAANAAPQDRLAYLANISFYSRHGNFDKVAEWLGKWATMEPQSPEAHYTASTYYWEKVYRDRSLSELQKRAYVEHGLQEADTAIAMNQEYTEALVYKNLFLRLQAQIESDPNLQKTLLAEADALRARGIAIRDARKAAGLPTETYPPPKPAPGSYTAYAAAPPPPPPPPPAVGPDGRVAPVRVGGNITPPVKIRDVKPIYPEEALQARVQGTVIIEATIDETGKVSNARILRSIPLFDQSALDAVRQWEYTPTVLSGRPVPVILITTVPFRIDK